MGRRNKVRVIRRNRETGQEHEIACCQSQGDALWIATLFESHKVISVEFQHFVRDGKKVVHPAGAINPQLFHTWENLHELHRRLTA